MLDLAYLNTSSNVVEDSDLSFKKATFAVAEESVFKNVGDNFFMYNEYIGCFSGFLVMKACTLNGRNTPIVKLPVTPLFGEAILTGFIRDEPTMFVVDKDGNLTLNEPREISENVYINIIGTFPIIGGGIAKRLFSLLSFLKRKVVAVC